MPVRGLYRRLAARALHDRLALDSGGDNTPVYEPLYIFPTEGPSGTLVEGSIWFDDDNHTLAFFDGTDNVEVVKTTSTGDLTVVDDLFVGDDLTLTSTGAILQMGPTATNPIVLTQSANTLTLASGDTLAITSADKLTVNSVIVPQVLELSIPILLHATATEYMLWTAPAAYEVTAITMTPSILQGGALTGTVVKVADTATPVKTTTPMHSADGLNFNTSAYTKQTVTLTATGADLQLAAGGHIGIDFSAALTVGKADIAITLKRI